MLKCVFIVCLYCVYSTSGGWFSVLIITCESPTVWSKPINAFRGHTNRALTLSLTLWLDAAASPLNSAAGCFCPPSAELHRPLGRLSQAAPATLNTPPVLNMLAVSERHTCSVFTFICCVFHWGMTSVLYKPNEDSSYMRAWRVRKWPMKITSIDKSVCWIINDAGWLAKLTWVWKWTVSMC